MADATIDRSATSNIFHVFIGNSSVTTGAGLTGLTNASSGLIISAMKPGDASATVYSVASSNVETITTIGTYAAPSSGKIRFKEIDSTNRPGWYEFHPANALFALSSDTTVTFTFIGATNMRATAFTVQVGQPANMTRIDGSATSGNNATLNLKQLNIQNSAGHAIYAVSTATSSIYSGIWAEGSPGGSGVSGGAGIVGQGGAGDVSISQSSGAGIDGRGGYNGDTTGLQTENGGPGIRGLGGGSASINGGAPGITAYAGGLNGDGIRLIVKNGAGIQCGPNGTGNFISASGGSTGGHCIVLNAVASDAHVFDLNVTGVGAGDCFNLTAGNDGGVGIRGSFSGYFSPTGILSEPQSLDTVNNGSFVCTAFAGAYPDDTFNGFEVVTSSLMRAKVTDYTGSSGTFTIEDMRTGGNWLSNPEEGVDTFQLSNFPFELSTFIATDVLDSVIESGITASSALTNDSGTQLTSINVQQALALMLSALAGKLAGAATTNVTVKQGGKPTGNTRIDATVDSSGNRSALTLKVPD